MENGTQDLLRDLDGRGGRSPPSVMPTLLLLCRSGKAKHLLKAP